MAEPGVSSLMAHTLTTFLEVKTKSIIPGMSFQYEKSEISPSGTVRVMIVESSWHLKYLHACLKSTNRSLIGPITPGIT